LPFYFFLDLEPYSVFWDGFYRNAEAIPKAGSTWIFVLWCAVSDYRRRFLMDLDQNTIDRLVQAARQAMLQAYVPVSGFPVGAALLTDTGEIYAGCNTESIIAGLGVCAERSAVDHAVIHGRRIFVAVAVASKREQPLFPCGACRQYLSEFAQKGNLDPMVYAVGANGEIRSASLSQLIPESFGPCDM
jgi:cytidine deaminase